MKLIDLSGIWNCTQKGTNKTIPIRIPGDNYTALLEAEIIPHPYEGLNELDVQWVGKEDWIFSRSFNVGKDILSEKEIFLHIDSLDTIIDIKINNIAIESSDNMFIRTRCDITKFLIEGENEIKIFFASAEKIAKERAKNLPYEIPHTLRPVYSEHRNLVRKVQCHSGWDWGPCIMVTGIYGRIYIGAHSKGRIDYVYTNMKLEDQENNWKITVTIEMQSPIQTESKIRVEMRELDIFESTKIILKEGKNKVIINLLIENPELWWPSGYGKQHLYDLTVTTPDDTLSKQIGFRQLEVVTEDDDIGRSMIFRVNGRDIFCKGANWIPIDALPSLQSPDRYEKLLSDAIDANMNMIRVWGGGQYELELFYKLCDEKGILIWQDFMFACSLYPADRKFLTSVEKEISHQVKRLKDHPCIAIWCGDNENVGALNWFAVSMLNRERYLNDYIKLNKTISNVVKRLDPDRKWWPSSPCAGEDDYSDNWHDDSKGDMHYWSVWHEGKPFEAYYEVTPRFCSEFGFQSFPSLETVKTYASKDQWDVTSAVMEHHQKNINGNEIITKTIEHYFKKPGQFEEFLYLSQVNQVYAIKTAVEYWRSKRPTCMGVLYWQLNDLWPVASWSSIEYTGKWKLLHYAAKKFYQPIHIVAFSKDNYSTVEIWGINDTIESWEGILELYFIDFSGQILDNQQLSIKLNSEGAIHLKTFNVEKDIPFNRENGFLYLSAKVSSLIIENTFFFTQPKQSKLQPANITFEIDTTSSSRFLIRIITDKPAFFVALDFSDIQGTFSENCFTLIPDQIKKIFFYPESDCRLTPTEAQKLLKLFYLRPN
ncbi:MAG: glycoside hydrolase family 2 protein [Candidatus Heimdallarchaeota archaeon]|nr:MAG: glycoside hydrolase family 2 protein [Candidatus Heimdallarchaeota archaeon]